MITEEIQTHTCERETLFCLDCNVDISYGWDPGIALSADTLASVPDVENRSLCLRCLESRLGRTLIAKDIDESHERTLEGYVTNTTLRDRIGPQLTLRGLKTLAALYRSDISVFIPFRDLADPLLRDYEIDNRCITRKQRSDLPYWLSEAPEERWALFAHDADPWAVMLFRAFDDGRSTLCGLFQLAYSHPLRKNVAPLDVDTFSDCCEELASYLFVSSEVRNPSNLSRLRIMSDLDARSRLSMILNEVDLYPCTAMTAWDHYDPVAPVFGNPSPATLSYVGDLAYGTSHLPSAQFLSWNMSAYELS